MKVGSGVCLRPGEEGAWAVVWGPPGTGAPGGRRKGLGRAVCSEREGAGARGSGTDLEWPRGVRCGGGVGVREARGRGNVCGKTAEAALPGSSARWVSMSRLAGTAEERRDAERIRKASFSLLCPIGVWK